MRGVVALVAIGLAAGQTPTFQAGVSQVRVDAEVLSHSRPVVKLGAQHFLVRDNGEPQPVVHVSQNVEPLDIVLLFDVSGSMKPTVERVAASARKALAQLRPEDRVAIMTFASRPGLVTPFTDDLERVREAIEEKVLGLPFEGSTRILDGVNASAETHFAERRSGRRHATLIITDNYGQRGQVGEQTALESYWEADTVLCGLIVRNPAEARRTPRPIRVNRIAEETGGDILLAEDPGEAFGELIERLRARYSIYYAMPKGQSGETRNVRIELQGVARQLYPEARVYARKGYKLP